MPSGDDERRIAAIRFYMRMKAAPDGSLLNAAYLTQKMMKKTMKNKVDRAEKELGNTGLVGLLRSTRCKQGAKSVVRNRYCYIARQKSLKDFGSRTWSINPVSSGVSYAETNMDDLGKDVVANPNRCCL